MSVPAPLVRIEDNGDSIEFTSYLVCSFSPSEGICHFRRTYIKEDERLIRFMEGRNSVTLTLFADPEGKIPRLRISGYASLFILSNTVSRPEGIIEDLQIQGDIEYL